ncbi:MAG TPA: phage tail sheath C-terminal domain-containing protein [Dinghuibacter sp.]|uniref:phage tail sheath family protein n=1 Tax=Dinghuibacter sp. TaxID=2024697 RepID=UPI002C992574|nr:phage tail sheath C-terminal domain-containing protein [Dinghuibacter sp.]HTJ14039.1 phage tail sheath C-terminal domain-containing protein [Dinghuibacter sp.]
MPTTTYKTPGVYIQEIPAFPSSAVAVETAVPVFIGYTETAVWAGKSLVNKPTKVSSFAEYVEQFGGAFRSKFTIADPDPKTPSETFLVNGAPKTVTLNKDNVAYLFNSIRLFYANGGGDCYILSVGTYSGKDTFTIQASDFIGSTDNPVSVFSILEKEFEPTMVVMPDIIALGKDAYAVYTQALMHCDTVQSRVSIFDVRAQGLTEKMDDVILEFRTDIGTNFLNYGAAYYPWLKTSIVQPSEVDFRNLDASVDLTKLLPETNAQTIATNFKAANKTDDVSATNYHNSLTAASPTYVAIIKEVRSKLNELPPSGAMAGIYTLVDNSRGVWKAPANVSLSLVDAPTLNISAPEQEGLNVDVMAGKSINVIRPFPGIGTLVWGARTLEGNSQDYRYINVRRTLIMIEQSLKLATRTYVFEPNDANTWVTVKGMMVNFLSNLWKQGALAGAVPEQAFDVQIGLGATMTPNDILDGIMRVTIKLAIVHPAEFIELTFQQQQQQS